MDAHDHPPASPSGDSGVPYASPVGPRILKEANTIHEDFPVSKYILYFIGFALEVLAVFWIGLHLVR
jgi:hypothetical protein